MRGSTGHHSSTQHQRNQLVAATTTTISSQSQSRRRQFMEMSAGAVVSQRNNDKETPTVVRPNSASPQPSSGQAAPELPSYLHDPVLNRTYARGRYLGKGGFAWCYEVTDVRSHNVFALKVVPKSRVVKPRHRNKVLREISIHQPLRHPNVVRLYSAFEDVNNIYMVLEFCQLDSLVSVMKQRKTLTESETRHYMLQLLTGVQYLHEQARVLHRDLKLGNMLLTSQYQVKIADFGLASEMGRDGCDHFGQVCGTPNYISPEVLRKEGHSSASEAWAIGCIMFAMLVGKPPFETMSLDTTYALILACQYSIPSHSRLSSAAKDLIRLFLHPQPDQRPTAAQAMMHEFFSAALPVSIPIDSCQFMPSNFAHYAYWSNGLQTKTIHAAAIAQYEAPPQVVVVHTATTASATYPSSTPFEIFDENRLVPNNAGPTVVKGTSNQQLQSYRNVVSTFGNAAGSYSSSTSASAHGGSNQGNTFSSICALDSIGNVSFDLEKESALTRWLVDMLQSLNDALHHSRGIRPGFSPPLGPPSNIPIRTNIFYVIKWIDYSNRYGFGCQLNNGGVSIMRNDRTRICVSPDRNHCRLWYSDPPPSSSIRGSQLVDLTSPTNVAQDSLDVVRHFVDYMDANLMTGGFSDAAAPPPAHSVPFIVLWRRFSEYLLIVLSDGTFQINFLGHHTKMVLNRLPLSPNQQKPDVAVTFIDDSRMARSYVLNSGIGSVIDVTVLQRVRNLLAHYILGSSDCYSAEI